MGKEDDPVYCRRVERNLKHETPGVRDVSSWLVLMRYESCWLKAVVRLGRFHAVADEARGCGLAWQLNLANSRGKMIGRTLRFLNFEVQFIEPPEKDHELSCQQEINQHDSPLKPSVCGPDLGDCPYVVLEDLPWENWG